MTVKMLTRIRKQSDTKNDKINTIIVDTKGKKKDEKVNGKQFSNKWI